MAAIDLITPEIVRYGGTAGTHRQEYEEAAAQSYSAGTPVQLNSSGQVQQLDGSTGALSSILGIDTHPASGTTGAKRSIEVLTGSNEIRVSVWHSGGAGSSVTSQALLGATAALAEKTVGTQTKFVVLIDGAQFDAAGSAATPDTRANVVITGLDPEYAEGSTSYAPVYCKVIGQRRQYQV